MDWTPHYHREAVQGIYRLGRGAAGEVTEAITELLRMEDPTSVGNPVEDVENAYRITIDGHIVEYEMPEKGNIIKILNIV